MKTVTFYHSVICPRCQLAGRSLAKLLAEFPNVRLDKVELLTNRARARAAGVRQIPALVHGDTKLTGFYLTKSRIRRFLESL